MKKKMLALLLGFIMIISLVCTGCSSNSSSTAPSAVTPSTAPESDQTTAQATSQAAGPAAKDLSGDLTIWAWGAGAEGDTRTALMKIFKEEHPELNVDYSVFPTQDGVWDQKASAALASGTGPDVIQMSPDYYAMNTKYYMDLNPYVKADSVDLSDVLVDGMISGYYDPDGKLEGFPLLAYGFVMAYNKDMFDSAGVAYPKPGYTWDDVANWGKTFAKGTGASQTYALVKHWCMNSFMIYSEGGVPYSSDLKTSSFDSPQILAAMKLYQQYTNDGIIPTDTAQQTIPAATLFMSKLAAMYPLGGYEVESFINDAETNGVNLGFTTMPSDPSGKEVNVLFATGWAITTTSKNPDAAWQFLKESAYANDEMCKATCAAGITASKKMAKDYYGTQTVGKCGFSKSMIVDSIPKCHLNPLGGTLSSAGNIWSTMVQAITLDAQEPADVQTQYAPQIAAEFKNYGF
jgi:multiple sugar transport system substrate-binding protein